MPDQDSVDVVLEQWARTPYDLPVAPMAVAKRVSRLAHHLDQLAHQALAPHGIDRGQYDVLAALLRSGHPYELTPTALNRAVLISSGGLTKRLAHLEQRGLITRRLAAEDRRSLLVALTETGRQVTAAATVEHARTQAEALSGLSPDDQATLAALLRVILIDRENDRAPAG
ncbi:MarR family winged helix-turn-helix transcriptional regulator [Actinoplanes sp. N902-109]|uniref:MarR family winged helix-turn-helix transcriptional regulator n=1 Tax=Actinoplanes sp. (strain N902-109) TaxID=649831 RepID=UPI00032952F6|nr:MarR family transcriptional regulator [Actinoplanes sp. N902-109]AGL20653.1 MarR family transcriptional regulator [Actinoplanes sp. N902-109]